MPLKHAILGLLNYAEMTVMILTVILSQALPFSGMRRRRRSIRS